jgi:LmbE family N-acetylglucosaminyl deacetylase
VDVAALFGDAPVTLTIRFENGPVTIYEIEGYTEGTLPDSVQIWEDPKDGKTDLVLFSTHCDDEHLFFAGVLPYYAGEKVYEGQLVYMTSHNKSNGYTRMHEALDGLWTAGVRNYPIWGEYYDYPVYTLADAYRYFDAYGWPEEEMLGFVVEQLRRFKPTVAVGHDLNGEYGHGQHMVWADLLAKAADISADESR